LAVGRVAGAHGIQGELKVEILTEDPPRFFRLTRVYIGPEGDEPEPRALLGIRLHKGQALLTIEACQDRDAAQDLIGYLVQVPLEEAIPLDEGEYYEHQVVGLAVVTASGEPLGVVEEILYTGANDVYVVRAAGGGQILIPAIKGVVLGIDLDAGRIVVELPDGLL
jgi:16S rRNA processing protein RimM